MSIKLGSIKVSAPPSSTTPPGTPIVEEEEFYSSWSLFLVCLLLILSLWTSYYLQIKRIRAVHETLVSIFAGMFVGLVVRLAPGTMIREMLVSARCFVVLSTDRRRPLGSPMARLVAILVDCAQCFSD
jgi:sodium/hydrogen exchanger-like protein 6/7